MAPKERFEALALAVVAKGAGTHAVEGVEGVQEAVVEFAPGELGEVRVSLRGGGAETGVYRFRLSLPDAAPAPAKKEEKKRRIVSREDALARLRRGVEENPESPAAWHALGNLLIVDGKPEEAAEALAKALELGGGNPAVRYDLGVAQGEMGRHVDAEKLFAALVAEDPGLTMPHSHIGVRAMLNLSVALSNQGKSVQALEALRPAEKLAWGILAQLGAHAMDAGRHAEAVNYFFGALSFGPGNGDVLHGLGRSLLRLGRNADASAWLARAVDAEPKCIHARYDLGLALARQGRRREARRSFRAALRLDSGHAWSWYDLGCLDALEGKRDAAFRKLRRAAGLGLNDVGHAEADADLASLRRDPRWTALLDEMRRARPGSVSEARG